MAKVYVFLATGFEEIEALTVVDILRRDKIEVVMVSIENEDYVTGSHQITVKADLKYEDADFVNVDMLILPGGPGHTKLGECQELMEKVKEFNLSRKRIAAICAAPSILGKAGVLIGKKAVCYPGYEEFLQGATVLKEEVVTDGNVTTSRGVGTAIPFALELVKLLDCETEAGAMKSKIIFKQ
ncbi:MAG TPA: DJ-1 family glyoxalase III [Lachnospiraceae bacterium]|jgi:protein deglycase|nr:DJ-1 family glyoxalase III [Lachnospiraceae bacterium]